MPPRRIPAPGRLGIFVLAALAIGVAQLRAQHLKPEAVAFEGDDGAVLRAELYRPKGHGPFPAVIALHGCGGLYGRDGALNPRHADWGERLAAQGYLVLLPDSFGSRGLGPQCREVARTVRPGRERTDDAFAAKAYLQGRPDVRPDAVSLLGWSHGGSTALSAGAARPPHDGRPGFARVVALYPGCRVPAERGLVPRAPLLLLVGGADDWTGAAPCERYVAAAQAAGGHADLVVYPGAYHDFDHPDLPVRVRRGLAQTLEGKGEAHIGTDPAARQDAIRRVMEFLKS